MVTNKSTEKSTQHAVLSYLRLRRILCWRNQSGQLPINDGLGRMKYMMKFGTSGSPDIFALHDGTLYGFEIKDIKGKQNENQIDFERRMNQAGGEFQIYWADIRIKTCFLEWDTVSPKKFNDRKTILISFKRSGKIWRSDN